MKKMVVMMDVYDERSKAKILRTVATCPGLTTISMDSNDGKLTVIGECFDVIKILTKLERRWRNAKMISFGHYDPKKETETATAAEAEKRKKEESERHNQSNYCPMHHVVGVCEYEHNHGCIIS